MRGMNPSKMRSSLFLFFSALLAGVFVIVGCGDSGDALQVRGSDTMVNLGSALAEEFMAEHPKYEVAVTGGGSGNGIASFINREVQVANSSRSLSEEEIENAESAGVEPLHVAVALDGLAVIVHPDNPISELTVDQIGAIFRGDVQNFSEVGGPDREITLYGRQSNSGTFVYFRKNILGGEDYSENMRRMNGNAAIVENVKGDPSGIGYAGVGYIVNDEGETTDEVKALNVATGPDAPAAAPTNADAVARGEYPIARPLYNVVSRSAYENNEIVREYVNFALSERGQEIATEIGFYPLSPEYREHNQEMGIGPNS